MSRPLRVAVLHYHLRRGGVTRVIENALKALAEHPVQTAVLCGEASPESCPVEARVVDGLGYASTWPNDRAATEEKIRRVAAEALGGPPDLWHIHNHSLGKNLFLPWFVRELAEAGEPMLLQIHDFAEDGRPENFRLLLEGLADGDSARLTDILYPVAPHIHYAPLNGRDEQGLLRAGLPYVQVLPNAVATPESTRAEVEPDPNLIVYPTRAIRRKNIGEGLLWAAVEPDCTLGVTLAPENPTALPIYESWVRLAEELALPVQFDLSREESFDHLMQRAGRLISTSVAEGFGLAFLEAWLHGKELIGRNLPDITRDFSGVDLSGLYDRLEVPLYWVGEARFRETLRQKMAESLDHYSKPLSDDLVDRAFAAAVNQDRVDFGRLDEGMQETVIRKIVKEGGAPALSPSSLSERRPPVDIAKNRSKVEEGFGLKRYGNMLLNRYQSLVEPTTTAPESLSADAVLNEFLKPEWFTLLRT